ncbi:hypothetical protein QUF54_10900 [Candidatus Marithioploca araucensis]|uniref:Uncharacterized protein n=1 Tax=Candidatus Marithioploca araucensis TaxID=70273 RepID=A0ABT7VWA8_9GAMM|nr:hypothetical protein [Candidatus Marithioploca araucensis]
MVGKRADSEWIKSKIVAPAYPPYLAVEKILFKQTNYIDENTSISAHQSINVYGKAKQKYEVRIGSRAVDVRVFVD